MRRLETERNVFSESRHWLVPFPDPVNSERSIPDSPAVNSGSVSPKKAGIRFPYLYNFLYTLRPCALLNAQSSQPNFAIREPGFDASSAFSSRSAPEKIMLIQQHETIGGVHVWGKCRRGQSVFVRLRGLDERPLLGKGIRHQRLHISGILMSRQENSGISFHLLQIAHTEVEPPVRVFRSQVEPPVAIRSNGKARFPCPR